MYIFDVHDKFELRIWQGIHEIMIASISILVKKQI